MNVSLRRWVPVILLSMGVAGITRVRTHERTPLRAPLGDVIPVALEGYRSEDRQLTAAEQQTAGVSDYLLRNYTTLGTGKQKRGFSVYVGYYERQGQGRTIHSPKNCLPGNGWEPLTSTRIALETNTGTVQVNRYILQRGKQRALVLYWYQGRGRVEANEYLVKRDLLVDAAMDGRSEEALVRVMIPVLDGQAAADKLADKIARALIPAANNALPL